MTKPTSLLASILLAQSAVTQMPTPSGGSGGQWEISTVANCTSGNAEMNPWGQSSSNTPTPSLARAVATVWGVDGSIRARARGNYVHKIKWVGSGPAPTYAYALVTSLGWHSEEDGGTGEIKLGLPLGPGGDDSHQNGRKIVRLKLDQNGEAIFNVSGYVNVIATSPFNEQYYSYCEGGYHSGVSLDFKALGLSFDSYTRKEDVTPTGPNVYKWPAGGDDAEHQKAEFSIVPRTRTVTTTLEPGVPPVTDPEPLVYEELDGGDYSQLVSVVYLGSWLSRPTLSDPTFNSGVTTGQRTNEFSSNYPYEWTGVTIKSNNLSATELLSMRESAKSLTVNASARDTHPSTPPELKGPFAADMQISLWAPERILAKVENSNRVTIDFPPLTCETNWFEVQPNISATQSVGIATTSQADFSGEVSLAVGASFGPFHGVGVKADVGVRIGKRWSKSVTGNTTISWGPMQPQRLWARFKATRTHTDTYRLLAKYGATGYESDFTSTVLDSKKPVSIGTWDIRSEYPGI